MTQEIIVTPTKNEDVVFTKIENILYGSFKANRKYKVLNINQKECNLEEISEDTKEIIKIGYDELKKLLLDKKIKSYINKN